MLRQEIDRIEEMIDEKLAAFKAELLAELKPIQKSVTKPAAPEVPKAPKPEEKKTVSKR